MCSLVMSPFSRDYMKTEIDQIKYQQCFNWFTRVQNSHSAWFLDGRTYSRCWLYIGNCVVSWWIPCQLLVRSYHRWKNSLKEWHCYAKTLTAWCVQARFSANSQRIPAQGRRIIWQANLSYLHHHRQTVRAPVQRIWSLHTESPEPRGPRKWTLFPLLWTTRSPQGLLWRFITSGSSFRENE